LKSLELPEESDVKIKLIRVAVIGCGRICRDFLLPSFARMPVSLEGLWDEDASSCERLAQAFAARWVYRDIEEISRDNIDAVLISPDRDDAIEMGKEIVRRLKLNKKKSLWLPAESAARYDILPSAARTLGKTNVTFGFVERFSPAFAAVEEVISGGYLRPLAHMEYSAGINSMGKMSEAIADPAATALASALDVLLWLVDSPQRIYAQGDPLGGMEVLMNVDEAVVRIAVQLLPETTERWQHLKFLSEDGNLLQCVDMKRVEFFQSKMATIRGIRKSRDRDDPLVESGWSASLASFFAAVEGAHPGPCDLDHALRIARLLKTINRSVETSRPVNT
jgi:predicted dehydrogenase